MLLIFYLSHFYLQDNWKTNFFQNKEAADKDRCLFEIMYKILECSNVDQSVP